VGDLSEHFSRSEFACRCGCGFDSISPELITEKHNAKVGGVPNSQHVQGIAADIVVSGRTPALVADYLERKYPDRYGVGRYSSFTHIDVRPVKARWRG
jgi:uncharacterized protein YcbK (DUF882 family)